MKCVNSYSCSWISDIVANFPAVGIENEATSTAIVAMFLQSYQEAIDVFRLAANQDASFGDLLATETSSYRAA
ncbi:hypothetical protein [Granulicella sp. S190]|jgi:hypothetical protein|uniref:hypothetical protein n=1 Tax=Granulicella sp. S190 TaxID=1747226 RepID=UPI00131BEB3C|nr:hypothetical protein [Granulicella sp. S190]